MLEYPWKGNLFQIDSFCERLILTSTKRSIDEIAVNRLLRELYPDVEETEQEEDMETGFRSAIDSSEARKTVAALKKYGGDRMKAAKELGISKTTLWRRMKKYEIEEETM